MTVGVPHAISWNLTQRCNLSCGHCYLDANAREGGSDPSTEECLGIVEQIAELNAGTFLILTGGEPLLRPDLEVIAGSAVRAGLTVVIGTNGTLVDGDMARRLKETGVLGVGISLDAAAQPALHDQLRGHKGAWNDALRGLDHCREADLDVMVQTSVFRWNRDDLRAVAEIAAEVGARAWNVYFLVCTGRGQELTDLTAHEYEETLHELRDVQIELSERLLVSVRCAPQFRRVAAEDPTQVLNAYPSGCPAAIHYMRIGPDSEVTPCPYMPSACGSLREQSLGDIWQNSELLVRLRDRSQLTGRCGSCTYRDTCGGCRARALAVLDDPMAQDPSCDYDTDQESPPVPEPTFGLPSLCTLPWTEAAVARLDRVPSFLRGLVIRRVEEATRERGADQVTPEIMKDVRARMMPESAGGSGFAGMAAMVGKRPPTSSESATERDPEPANERGSQPVEITWTPEALGRLDNAPDFVQPGILKLMRLRAEQRGITTITSDFLSEIRDESMMRVSKIMRKFGLSELRPESFREARRRMAKQEKKLLVLDQIEDFLRNRTTQSSEIRAKFQSFLDSAGSRGPLWMPDALARVDALAEPERSEVRRASEEEARRIKAPVITRGIVARVLPDRTVD